MQPLKVVFYGLVFPLTLGFGTWQGWQWWSWASAPVESDIVETVPGSLSEQMGEDGNSLNNRSVYIEIEPGTSGQEIGQTLHEQSLIRSVLAWNLWTRWQSLQDQEGGFLAGTYRVSPSDPLGAIALSIWQGDVVQRSITIPEGWAIQQMSALVESEGIGTAEEFIAATRDIPYTEFPWLPAQLPHLEGFLYPDTYQITEETTPSDLVIQMVTRFEDIALPIYEQGEDQSPYSFLDWVTLASIVEREAVISEERPTIANVFARRLRLDMPLGADPTVEYALGIQQTQDQPLTLTDVQTDSPYNTYLYPGLPPTPIASPGVASLNASLNPGNTEYLYFMARYDGTHIFSRTLAEHNAAINLVERQLNEPPDNTDPSPDPTEPDATESSQDPTEPSPNAEPDATNASPSP